MAVKQVLQEVEMETSPPAPQGSSLLLQLSAPRVLSPIPIQAQAHEMTPPVPPRSHCCNHQMQFMQFINCFGLDGFLQALLW